MNIKEVQRVHFIGIGGIGISYIAHYFLRQGAIVSGSDLAHTQITDQLAARGVSLYKGHSAEYITNDIQLVIANDAVPADNPERLKAKELGIPTLSNFAVVGHISDGYKTLAIAGNKGKTTTSAMLATILEKAGCDPTAMIGSIVNDWQCNFRQGQSDLFVIEADEYKEHFLEIDTNIAVITNIAADHLDYFENEQGVINAFQKFADKLPNNGTLIINQDDELTKKIQRPNCEIITFGMETTADIMAIDYEVGNGRQFFTVMHHGDSLGRFSLPAPGKFNVYNALAAIAVGVKLGVDPQKMINALSEFKGTWRRFQILGRYKMATVISDYAHNPVSVHAVLEGTEDFYPEERKIAVFQPHSRHRTQSLFKEFVRSLDPADIVVIPDIYDVSGREVISKEEMNAQMLVDAIKERDAKAGRGRLVIAPGNLDATKAYLDSIIDKNDVLLMIGAGDIYQLAEHLV